MNLNLDRSIALAKNTTEMAWEESPSKGVYRKKLERESAESGLTTSVVKYEQGTSFSAHAHPGGEEIFVLEGVFEDEHGKFPKGTYFRNPPGSSHSPKSPEGCELFVKLNQFQAGDNESVKIETAMQQWLPGLVAGLSVMPLHSFGTEHTALVRWQAGTHFQPHVHAGGEEIFVLEGVFEDEHGVYPKGTWLRSPNYSKHNPFSEQGCIILVKTGYMSGQDHYKANVSRRR